MRLSHVLAAIALMAFAGGTASAQQMAKPSPSASMKSSETMNKATTKAATKKKTSSMHSSSMSHMMASPKPSATP